MFCFCDIFSAIFVSPFANIFDFCRTFSTHVFIVSFFLLPRWQTNWHRREREKYAGHAELTVWLNLKWGCGVLVAKLKHDEISLSPQSRNIAILRPMTHTIFMQTILRYLLDNFMQKVSICQRR